jgi:phosphinothricin acetyltransferase
MTQIRFAVPGDAGAIAAIYAPIVAATPISFEEVAPAPDDIRKRMAYAATWPWLVAEREGAVAGYVYASQHRSRAAYRWSVDTSAYVAESARRTGLASQLYAALFRLLAAQGYRNAFAGITLPNEASVALHRAVGFEPIGVYRNAGFKLGAWHDVSWWQRELLPPGGAPDSPVDVDALAPETIARALAGPEV